ncbi:MAG TPA: AIM24 family protein [Gemmatimonadales bacterium]|nr:AIM24 family protein [Gemmatimonadales bacterium]
MATPVLLPTSASNETFGGVTYHLEGELVPVLHIELDKVGVYFEHHVLLWKHPAVVIGIKSLAGAFKRILSGMPVFMTEATGRGHIAFSRDGAGHVVPMHLKSGQTLEVREHQFLAATASVDYAFQRVKGVANLLMGGTGFFIDTFHAARGEGIVWLHGYGNVFELTLAGGESIDVEPGAWVYKDPTVKMETQFQKLTTGLFASAGQLVWNRFTGPGRLGIQSMSLHLPSAE